MIRTARSLRSPHSLIAALDDLPALLTKLRRVRLEAIGDGEIVADTAAKARHIGATRPLLLRRSLMGLAFGKCERGYDNKRECCQPETSSHGHDCLLHDRGPSAITGGEPTGSRDKPRSYAERFEWQATAGFQCAGDTGNYNHAIANCDYCGDGNLVHCHRNSAEQESRSQAKFVHGRLGGCFIQRSEVEQAALVGAGRYCGRDQHARESGNRAAAADPSALLVHVEAKIVGAPPAARKFPAGMRETNRRAVRNRAGASRRDGRGRQTCRF